MAQFSALLNQFASLIGHHMAATGIGSGVLMLALISCLPERRPRTVDDWYAYIRESLQTAIPASRRHPSQPDAEQPPAQTNQQ